MTRFAGMVGYGTQVEAPLGSGVWKDVIVERKLFGDVVRNTKQNVPGEYVNDNISVSNSISVVADPYATANFFRIRYVVWNGARWKVTDVEVNGRRLVLRLGEIYNGPIPS